MQLTQSSAIDSKKLREYGLIMAGMLSVIFGLALPFAFGKQLPIWPFAAALVFASTALLKPILLSGVYTIWMKFGHFAGAINSKILLTLVFFLLILPYGVILRIAGRDTLKMKFDQNAKSYREIRAIPYSPKTMEKPY
jgi:hypothetical protein